MNNAKPHCGIQVLLLAIAVLVASLGSANPVQLAGLIYVTNFAKNANMQNNLQSSFPSGLFTANNSFGTTFDITSDTNGNNFVQMGGGSNGLGPTGQAGTYTVNVNQFGVTDVYTLMNAYGPTPGATLAQRDITGTGGATETFTLINGTNVRDFYDGSYADSINGTTTQNAFTINNVRGAAGTGNSQTGLTGTYYIDEQQYVLSAAFATQTLETITYTYSGSAGTPILEGITLQTAAAPEPASLTLLGIGIVGLAGYGWRRRKQVAVS